MTRFWLTLEHGVKFVINCLEQMHGGEIFVPKIPSMRLLDLAETIRRGARSRTSGFVPAKSCMRCWFPKTNRETPWRREEMFVIQPHAPLVEV